jgi:hypothetical protein
MFNCCFIYKTHLLFHITATGPSLWSSDQSSWLQNGDVLCFLWGTNWIYICYIEESRLPLWSSDQSSWLQIQRSGYDSQRYQIFWEVVGLERGPLTTHEYNWGGAWKKKWWLQSRNPRIQPWGSCHADHVTPSIRKSWHKPSTIGGHSVSIVRSRTQATEFFFLHNCNA